VLDPNGEDTGRIYQERTHIYDLQDDAWVRGPDLPAGISNLRMVNHGGRVLAVGGYDQLNGFAKSRAIYELTADGWILRPEMLFTPGGEADIVLSTSWQNIPVCQPF